MTQDSASYTVHPAAVPSYPSDMRPPLDGMFAVAARATLDLVGGAWWRHNSSPTTLYSVDPTMPSTTPLRRVGALPVCWASVARYQSHECPPYEVYSLARQSRPSVYCTSAAAALDRLSPVHVRNRNHRR